MYALPTLSKATPWWVGVCVEPWPDGYRLRIRSRRPPHFRSSGETVRGPGTVADCIIEILRTLQHFIGREADRAWPADDQPPRITGPLRSGQDLDQHVAELRAWSNAFPAPGVRIEGDRLLAWYGAESGPVLSLPPIPLHAS